MRATLTVTVAATVVVMASMVGCKKKPAQNLAMDVGSSNEPIYVGPEPIAQAPQQPSYMMAPAPAPMPSTSSYAPSRGGTYVVQKGDTIFAISRKIYGSNTRAKDIIAANPGINPDRITVGQVLNLP